MMRLSINRNLDQNTSFACWRVDAPRKPITRKGLGQRMGGGKGAIDHYVTPVKAGQLIVEVGGHIELGEVESVLKIVAKKLPFPAKVCFLLLSFSLSAFFILSCPFCKGYRFPVLDIQGCV